MDFLAGLVGVPWGPIWTIGHGVTNAMGGTRDADVDEALLWQNALAFASRGDGSLAVGLGNILRKSNDAQLARNSADLIRFFSERGVDTSTTLKDAWERSVVRTLALFGVLFAIPSAALALVISSQSATSQSVGADKPYADLSAADQRGASSDDPLKEVFGNAEGATTGEDVAVKPSPTCSKPPTNGELLTDKRESTEKGHVLQIENGTEGPAIVKLRDATTEKTIASFFVEPSRTASLTEIPDGTYRVQYAFGDKLGVDCRTFVQLASAGAFPGTETLTTRYEEEFGGTRISRSRLSYTLYAVPGGNVRPEDIAPSDFNKP